MVVVEESKSDIKISILLPDFRGGGAERVNLTLANEFTNMGHEVEFVLMQAKGELLDEALSAYPVIVLNVPRYRKVPIPLVHYFRKHRPDIMLVAMWPLTALAAISCRLSGCKSKLLVSEHSILSLQHANRGPLHRLALRVSMAIGYRLASVRVGVSSGVVSNMASLANMRAREFHVIHNPVPLGQSVTTEIQQKVDKLWGEPRGRRVLSVGCFKSVKNHQLLLRAAAELEPLSSITLMFVGNGEGENALRILAEELGISERVVFVGFHNDPTPFYHSADLFVLSSNIEGFGNVLVEALACGTPVVSTDCPSGPSEILDSGRFGRLTPVGNVEALAEAINESLSEAVDSAVLIDRALQFDPSVVARKYLSAFQK